MPQLNYSPWGQATDSMLGVNASMNNVALGVAKIRYQQALQQQRQAIALGQLAIRQELAQQQGAHYNAMSQEAAARAGQASSVADINRAKLESANEMETGVRRMYAPDMTQGPTQEAAAMMNLQDIYGGAARNAGLGNEGYRLLEPNRVSANAMSYSPIMGQQAGPINIAPGHMYQAPGGEPVINPQQARPDIDQYRFAPGIGLYNRNTAEIKVPASGNQGIRTQDALHAVESPNYIALPPEVQALLMGAITNKAGISQGATQPNISGKPSDKSLDADTAKQFLQQAGGDKDKARQMAREAGYSF